MQVKEKRNKILIIAITIIMLFNFILPNFVFADAEGDDENFGGKLFRPIAQLFAFFADIGIELVQFYIGNGKFVYQDGEYKVHIGPAAIFTGQIPRTRC